MNDEERIGRIEEAIITMQNLIVSHDERLEDYFKALRESREDFNFKLNALIDAQIRNETDITQLKESIKELAVSTNDLKEASQSQLQRIENLENK
jgi:hypothetical protein